MLYCKKYYSILIIFIWQIESLRKWSDVERLKLFLDVKF